MKYYIAKDTFDNTPVVFTEKEVYDYEEDRALLDILDYFDNFCKQEKLSRYEILTSDHKKLEERYVTWYIKYMIDNEWVEVELTNDTIQSIKNGD